MSQEFKTYMDRLDQSARRNINLQTSDLIHILHLLETQSSNQHDFSDLRKGLWFRLASRDLDTSSGNQLIELMYMILKEIGDPDKYYPGFFHNWEHTVLRKMSEINDPISILHLYRMNRKDPPEEIIRDWCRVMSRKVDTLSAAQLADIMDLFASFKIRPEDDFLHRWSQRVESMLGNRQLDGHGMSEIAFACGKLDIEQLRQPLAHALLDRSTYTRMNGQQVTKAIYGCLLLKLDLSEYHDFVQYFYDATARNMTSLDARSLSHAIWSTGRLPHEPSQEFATSWNRQFISKANTCTAKDLAVTLQGLRTLADRGHQISSSLTSSWLGRAETVIDDFWPDTVPRILIDLHHINASPRSEFVRKCLHAIKGHLEHVYARDYAQIMITLADMNANPNRLDPDFVHAWASEAIRHDKARSWSPSVKEELKAAFQKMGVLLDRDLERLLHSY